MYLMEKENKGGKLSKSGETGENFSVFNWLKGSEFHFSRQLSEERSGVTTHTPDWRRGVGHAFFID